MMRIPISIALAFAFALILGACSSTSQYATAGKSYADAVSSANDSVKKLSDQRQRVARIDYVDARLIGFKPSNETIEKQFTDFACAGAGVLSTERSKLKMLSRFGGSIEALTKQPDMDIVSLLDSIATVDEKMKPLSLGKDSTEQADCASEVTGLLAMKIPARVESGVGASLIGFKSLVGALNDITVIVVGQIDEQMRAAALRKYVQSNTKTIETLLREISSTDTLLESLCNGADDKSRPYCRIYNDKPADAAADYVPPVPTKIAAQFVWQKRASLSQPFLRFQVALHALSSAKNVQDKAAALDAMLKVHRFLGEYDALRTTPAPEQLATGVREAHQALVKVSEGGPPGSGWAQLKAWADALGGIAKGLSDAQDAIDKAKE
jgi:hypothetical protein